MAVTAHALVIIFSIVTPTIRGGFRDLPVPVVTGAPDIAFPPINNIIGCFKSAFQIFHHKVLPLGPSMLRLSLG